MGNETRRRKNLKREIRRAYWHRAIPLFKTVGEPRRQSWVLFGLLLALGYVLHILLPLTFSLPYVISFTGWIPFSVSLLLVIIGHVVSHPKKGERKTTRPKLITTGLYSYTRNPIYLGFAMFFLGLGIAMDWIWFVIMGAALPVAIHFMVLPEEEAKFEEYYGDKYRDYAKRVPRWL